MTGWERCTEVVQRDVDQIHEILAAPCPDGLRPDEWEIYKGDLRVSLMIPGLLADSLDKALPPIEQGGRLMMVCSPCRHRRGWSAGILHSTGPCELCGKTASCDDITPPAVTPSPPPGLKPGDFYFNREVT